MNFINWYFCLKPMRKNVGIFDRYNNGKVSMIEFDGECIIVWVTYKTKTIAYRTYYN